MRPAGSSIARILRIVAGLIVWASAFVMLYATHDLACRYADWNSVSDRIHPVTWLLTGVVVLHLLVLGGLLYAWFRHPTLPAQRSGASNPRFQHKLEGWILALSVAGVLLLAAPLVLVSPCSG